MNGGVMYVCQQFVREYESCVNVGPYVWVYVCVVMKVWCDECVSVVFVEFVCHEKITVNWEDVMIMWRQISYKYESMNKNRPW